MTSSDNAPKQAAGIGVRPGARTATPPATRPQAGMKWSWRLGVFAGIPIYIHTTFVLIIVWVAWVYWRESRSLAAAVGGAAFILVLFGCVVLHELGHALTAKRFGIRTRDITLLPIGGLARLERMPDEPYQEFLVAIAGPAVNVVIAAVLYGLLLTTGQLQPLETLAVAQGPFWQRLMLVNVFLVLFNMLPAFPMDGGRVLRAALAMRMDYLKATQAASMVGQGMALLFAFLGLLTNPFLVFIALFVWIGAGQEASMVQMKAALSGIPIQRAMITDFRTLAPEDTLARAVDLVLATSQKEFPVVADQEVRGVLTDQDLFQALASDGLNTTVGEVMLTDFETADAYEMLEPALVRLQSCACRTIPVLQRGELVGLVTMDNIGEFLRIQSAMSGSG